MNHQALLPPLLFQVGLTFAVWIWLYVTRLAEMRRKDIDPQRLADQATAVTLLTDSAAPANNFRNLFELPVLFYLAVGLALLFFVTDPLLVRLAWGYVVLRALHSLIHCTYNRVLHRFLAHAASTVVLLMMWVRLASIICF